jgi:hypothetical protein
MSTQLVEGSEARVREAVERCLETCHGNAAPLAKLAECVEKLKAEGWWEAEIHRVEVTVLKMLVALRTPDDGEHGSDTPGYW